MIREGGVGAGSWAGAGGSPHNTCMFWALCFAYISQLKFARMNAKMCPIAWQRFACLIYVMILYYPRLGLPLILYTLDAACRMLGKDLRPRLMLILSSASSTSDLSFIAGNQSKDVSGMPDPLDVKSAIEVSKGGAGRLLDLQLL